MIKFIIAVSATIVIFLIIYLIAVNNYLRKKSINIISEKLPEEFNGYKIIFISDLHDCSLGKFSKNRLIKKVEKSKPDIIFLGGDMHEKKKKDEKYFLFLKELGKIAGIYFVEGNHENKLRCRHDFSKYSSEFNKYVINLNGQTKLVKNGKSINLYGCGYSEYEKGIFEFDPNRFSILLYHSPFIFDDFENPPDLMISGHVHGGIIELPFVGAVFSPGNGAGLFARLKREFLFPKYYKNSYKRGNATLVVGRGIGNFKYCPIRFIPPELIEITLGQ